MSYKEAALTYVGMGWMGVLPVPPGRKDPVPAGFGGGYDSAYPDREKIKSWIDSGFGAKVDGVFSHYSTDDANLALRLPNTVVGIDVDAYDGKKGRECLAHAEELWGPLPETLRSSSRIDGISGIRLYRVPPGTHLRTVITFPELGLDGIEICQFFHRYVIAWPSVHPTTKRVYRWLNHEGMPTTEIPRVGSIVDLPAKWVEELSRPPEQEITVEADVSEVLLSLTNGLPSQRVLDCLHKAEQDIMTSKGGRHDIAMKAVGALFRFNHEEEPGVRGALAQLGNTFRTAVTEDGSRTFSQARVEWERMVTGQRIHNKIASTPSRNKALEAVLGEKIPSLEAVMRPATIELGPPGSDNWVRVRQPWEYEVTVKDNEPFRIGVDPKIPPKPETHQDQLLDDGMSAIMGSSYVEPSTTNEGFAVPNWYHEQCIKPFSDIHDEFGSPFVVEQIAGKDWQQEPDDGLDMFDRILLGEEGSSTTSARTSWGPKDISALLEDDSFEPEPATIGKRDDGACLFYAGKTNALVGPPESAKSWVAQYVASQELLSGNSVLYLDFEDSDRGVVGRMRFLGVDKEEIRSHFLYVDPEKALDQDSAAELFRTIDIHNPTLVVIDGLGAVLAMHNHEMKDNTEYIKFDQLLLKPLAATGAAVVMIDHVAKNRDESDNYAIGAQSKLQMLTGAQIRVQAVKKFGRGREGKLFLWINKDRHGGVRENAEPRGKFQNDYWATVFVDARDTPSVKVAMRFETKEDQDAPNNQGKLHSVIDKVKSFLDSNGGASKNAISKGVGGNHDDVNAALDELVLRGEVEITEGPRKAKIHTLVQPTSKDSGDERQADLRLILGGEDDLSQT